MSVDQINWNIDSEIGRLWIPNSKQLPVAISIINESGINFQEVNTYLSVLLSSAYSSFLRCSGGKSERTLPETRAGSGFQPIIAAESLGTVNTTHAVTHDWLGLEVRAASTVARGNVVAPSAVSNKPGATNST